MSEPAPPATTAAELAELRALVAELRAEITDGRKTGKLPVEDRKISKHDRPSFGNSPDDHPGAFLLDLETLFEQKGIPVLNWMAEAHQCLSKAARTWFSTWTKEEQATLATLTAPDRWQRFKHAFMLRIAGPLFATHSLHRVLWGQPQTGTLPEYVEAFNREVDLLHLQNTYHVDSSVISAAFLHGICDPLVKQAITKLQEDPATNTFPQLRKQALLAAGNPTVSFTAAAFQHGHRPSSATQSVPEYDSEGKIIGYRQIPKPPLYGAKTPWGPSSGGPRAAPGPGSLTAAQISATFGPEAAKSYDGTRHRALSDGTYRFEPITLEEHMHECAPSLYANALRVQACHLDSEVANYLANLED